VQMIDTKSMSRATFSGAPRLSRSAALALPIGNAEPSAAAEHRGEGPAREVVLPENGPHDGVFARPLPHRFMGLGQVLRLGRMARAKGAAHAAAGPAVDRIGVSRRTDCRGFQNSCVALAV
jgi:hypothetical protein